MRVLILPGYLADFARVRKAGRRLMAPGWNRLLCNACSEDVALNNETEAVAMQLVPGADDKAQEDLQADAASTAERQIGEQIRELRRIKRLTLHQLAEMVGVSVGYLSQIERDRSKLPIGI